jgi:hypothetical protein
VFRLSSCGSVVWTGRSLLTGTSSKPAFRSSPENRPAADAGYAVDRFFAQLRAWSEAHPDTGLVVRNAEELQRLSAGESAPALKDKPPPKG